MLEDLSMSRPARKAPAALAAAALSIGLVGVVSTPAHAVDVEVTSWGELVAAIGSANADPDVSTITLTGDSSDYVATSSLPTIYTSIHFEGPGSADLTLDLNGTASFYISDVTGASIRGMSITGSGNDNVVVVGSSDIVLEDLVLTDANEFGASFTNTSGSLVSVTARGNGRDGVGVFFSLSGGTVEIHDSNFENNLEAGLLIDARYDSQVTVVNGTSRGNGSSGLSVSALISAQVSIDGFSSEGDGTSGSTPAIVLIGSGSSPSITAANLTVVDAHSSGIVADVQNQSTLTVRDSTVSGSGGSGIVGMALHNSSATFVDVTTRGNGGVGQSFDAEDAATLSVTRSVSEENLSGISLTSASTGSVTVTDSASARNDGGLALSALLGSVTVAGSTVSDNELLGALIGISPEASVMVVNSTISGNRLDDQGGGFCTSGLMVLSGDETAQFALEHSTIVDNEAPSDCGQVHLTSPITAQISHTIIAGATRDLWVNPSSPDGVSVDHTLVQSTLSNATVEAVLAAGTGNLIGVDPMLGSLADNGGHTLTHLPAESSPVVDAGVTSSSSLPATDQRGEARLAGAAVDLGAVELPRGLAATGVEEEAVWPLLAGGGVLLLLGAALVVFRVRRDRPRTPRAP